MIDKQTDTYGGTKGNPQYDRIPLRFRFFLLVNNTLSTSVSTVINN